MDKLACSVQTLANGKKVLYLDGSPMLTIGAQIRVDRWRNNGGWTNAAMSAVGLFGWAKKLNCNVVQVIVPWRDCEPEQGKYVWTHLDWAISECNKYDLRMDVVWFGANVCGSGWYAYTPSYITGNPETYGRIIKADGTPLAADYSHPMDGKKYTLCCEDPDTLAREQAVVSAMMAHLKRADSEHRVIGFQVENEPSIVQHNPGFNLTDRCHCVTCNVLFASQKMSAMEFSKKQLALYLNKIAGCVKESSSPLYTRVNWICTFWSIDEDTSYVANHAPNVDLVGFDTYGNSQAECFSTLSSTNAPYLFYGGNMSQISELGCDAADCRQKIIDSVAANGCGALIYQLAGWGEAEDNCLLDSAGAEKVAWASEIRGTFGMLRQAMVEIAVRKNGNTNEIQYFNCGGATSASYDQTKVLNDTNVRYQTSAGGIGIAINLDGRHFKIMSAKAGTFFVYGNIYRLSDYEVKTVSCCAADSTPGQP